MKLSRRLQEIAHLVPVCHRLIDVGTDHALLPLALLQQGVIECAIGIDKSEMPLAKARVNRLNADCLTSMDLVCADGLAGLDTNADDVVVMAGMGAQTMMGILMSTPWRGTLVIQPNRDLPIFRRWLVNNGWVPVIETLIQVREQWFWTSRWEHQPTTATVSDDALDFGVDLASSSPEAFRAWTDQEIERLKGLPLQSPARVNLTRLEKLRLGS